MYVERLVHPSPLLSVHVTVILAVPEPDDGAVHVVPLKEPPPDVSDRERLPEQ